MRKVYRLTKEKYAQDLSGTGSATFGARWNPKGLYVLYTAASPSLSLLEWLAHARDYDSDEVYCLITLLIPESRCWVITENDLPVNWRVSPPPLSLQSFGRRLVEEKKLFAMEVPSVLMPAESNLVLNTSHPLFSKVEVVSVEVLEMDRRLLRQV